MDLVSILIVVSSFIAMYSLHVMHYKLEVIYDY